MPPLRERAEDLPSLVLLALDRAARRVGREPVGIEADANAYADELRQEGFEAFLIGAGAHSCYRLMVEGELDKLKEALGRQSTK